MENPKSLRDVRALIDQSFEEWIPRRCNEKWIALLSDPPKFGWDVEAIQMGLIDPLYREFDFQPERWRPILAAKLLGGGGLTVAEFGPLLAASELCYLAFSTIRNIRNSPTATGALSSQETVPFSILVTVAYTTRQLALTLVFDHAPMLSPGSRGWLGYRFGRLLIQMGVGGAVDMLNAERGASSEEERRYIGHLKLAVCPLTFTIAADTAIAALDLIETPEGHQLQQAASHLGIAYDLATELSLLMERGIPFAPLSDIVPPDWSYTAAMGRLNGEGIRRGDPLNSWVCEKKGDFRGKAVREELIQKGLAAVRKEMDEMEFSLKTVRGGLARGCLSFAETAVFPKIEALERGLDAERV